METPKLFVSAAIRRHSGTAAADGEQPNPVGAHDNMAESPCGPEQYAVAAEVLVFACRDLDLPGGSHDGTLVNDDAGGFRHRAQCSATPGCSRRTSAPNASHDTPSRSPPPTVRPLRSTAARSALDRPEDLRSASCDSTAARARAPGDSGRRAGSISAVSSGPRRPGRRTARDVVGRSAQWARPSTGCGGWRRPRSSRR